MPCFSSGPTPGTPEYAEWLPDVSRKLDAFIHVVEYYHGKAGIPIPEPGDPDDVWAERAASEPDARERARVLQQILLHLDCDDVDMLELHDIRLLLHNDPASKGHRYAAVLRSCFSAMRFGFSDRPANDAQWRECPNPALMLDSLQGTASDRKLRLFVVACCRRAPHMPADERERDAVAVAERYADGHADDAELTAAEEAVEAQSNTRETNSPTAWVASPGAARAARMAAVSGSGEGEEEGAAQATLLRCILGSPFRTTTFPPAWRTDTAIALAAQMYESREFSATPILTDALQDAGCDNADVLDHCRGPGPHVRGCWVVDEVLGKA